MILGTYTGGDISFTVDSLNLILRKLSTWKFRLFHYDQILQKSVLKSVLWGMSLQVEITDVRNDAGEKLS
jgi:hypothetical protein